ncbi:MAG: hypothetical protein CL678_16510 [Bdellovibrionaceae bacterium]|nr:hypothetical protein [Pseudobdellovibrionaceae bacterium]|tara:strand:- start:1213 stop:2127 length:915 start_codon:yes stop_codon:yes gene_type:complete
MKETVFESLPPKKPTIGQIPSEVLSVFNYVDYREFLANSYEAKKKKNPSFSESAFCRKAGLGQNSRGYLKLVIQGKRNLTLNTMRGFIEALNLDPHEAIYFENLVFYNQSKKGKDKEYYFQRLCASSEGKESEQLLLKKSQWNYYSHWYYVAVRQIIGLSDFKNDLQWISKKLRNKVNTTEIQQAIHDLERMGLIRKENNTWVQSQPHVKYSSGKYNHIYRKFQSEMLERAKEALFEDDYEERYVSSVTLTCPYEHIDELKKMIDEFRRKVSLSLSSSSEIQDQNTVFHLGIELFQITPLKGKK